MPCLSPCLCGQELSIPTPLLQSKGGVEGAAAAEPERNEAVDAAIVRTMKSRKTLRHQELVHEVLTQIKYFRPDPKLIKRRINALMGEYLRREDPMSATSPYVYVQRRVGGCIFAFCVSPAVRIVATGFPCACGSWMQVRRWRRGLVSVVCPLVAAVAVRK